MLPKRPEHVLFLGDLLDGGWLTADDETFDATARRFERIFRWPSRRDALGDAPTSSETQVKKKYLSVHGNHDVGYASRAESFPEIRARHESRFGVSNYLERVGGVELVGVNAMALDGDPKSPATRDAWASRTRSPETDRRALAAARVLVTHLPLPKASYAPGSCGEARFGPVIQPRTRRTRRGVEYQDYLSDASAARLLSRAARPALVLAGHDHDRCAARHEIPEADSGAGTGSGDGDAAGDATGRRSDDPKAAARATVTELTLGTFSWLMGNPKPSFALMTLRGERPAAAEGNARHVDAAICDLPEHLAGVWSYAYLGAVSALVLLVWPSLRISAAFMRSGDVEAFARRAGIEPKAKRALSRRARSAPTRSPPGPASWPPRCGGIADRSSSRSRWYSAESPAERCGTSQDLRRGEESRPS